MINVLVLCGPTSTGKTSLALDIAKETDSVIISADSRQIYKYMDIGTGKIPINSDISIKKYEDHWFLNGIEIYGYDLVAPDEIYTAHSFLNYARNLINVFYNQNRNVILVGGTGFYLDSVTVRVTLSGAASNPELRLQLNDLSLIELQEKLQNLSMPIYEKIDVKNKVRLVRAIEKLTLPESNDPITEFVDNINFSWVGLTAPNPYMFAKVDVWAETIWSQLIDETKHLLDLGYGDTAVLNGLIYKSSKNFVMGTMQEQEAIQRIKFDLHAYIRRQMTWFKRNSDIRWFDISVSSYSQIKSDVLTIFSV